MGPTVLLLQLSFLGKKRCGMAGVKDRDDALHTIRAVVRIRVMRNGRWTRETMQRTQEQAIYS